MNQPQAAVSPLTLITHESVLYAAAPALITRFSQIALCWPAGMFPIVSALPTPADDCQVTPVGAVLSLTIVCSVPLIADVPSAISISEPAAGVSVSIQIFAASSVRAPWLFLT